jgi:nitrite reductase (NADH) large subunit
MVGHRFVEAMRARDADGTWRITVLAEEADAAYDRVGLTGNTEHWDRARLALPGNDYANDSRVRLRLGASVGTIDRPAKAVITADGERVDYDALVLATGSSPSCHRCQATTCRDATSTALSMTSTRSVPTPRPPSQPAMRRSVW